VDFVGFVAFRVSFVDVCVCVSSVFGSID